MDVALRVRSRSIGASAVGLLLLAGLVTPSIGDTYLEDTTVLKGITGAYNAAGVDTDFSEVRGGGAAVLDFDGDGDDDLYVTSNADRPNELYRNDGGTFVDVAASAGVAYGPRSLGAFAADLDNDGDPDLVVLNEGTNVLYRNEANGTFTNLTSASGFASSTKTSYSAAAGDYDLDGDLDLYIANWSFDAGPSTNGLWRNEGDLHFAEVTSTAGVGDPEMSLTAIWHDIDLDGDPDLLSVNEFEPDVLYRNEGDGTFADVTYDVLFTANDVMFADGMGVHIADADLDGLQDIYVTNYGKNNLYMNNGNGTWTDEGVARGCSGPTTTPWVGWGTEFFDCELDGDLDIYVANGRKDGGTSFDDLYINNGTGNYSAATDAGGPGYNFVGRGMVMSDFDGDGDQDIFIVNHNTPTRTGYNCYMENISASGNHWLQVRTRGIDSNAEGVGARVIVSAGGTEWIREVTLGSSFASSSSPTLTFGVGSHTSVDLRIEWPSGIVDEVLSVLTSRKVVVVEGQNTTLAVGDGAAPARPQLAAFPNPAHRASTITLELATAADVRVGAYTASGRLVRDIYSGSLPAGSHELIWDGRAADGERVAPGVYFLRLEEAGRVATTRLVTLD